MIRVSSSLYRGAILTAMLALAFVAGCKPKSRRGAATPPTSTASGRAPDGLVAGQPHVHKSLEIPRL